MVRLVPSDRAPVYDVVDVDAATFFVANGWVLTRVPDLSVSTLQRWVDEIASWPADGGEWLQYKEMTADGPKLCRSENFVPFHSGLRTFLITGSMIAAASALLGEAAVLYKEKINYKPAGGAGYAAHQDAPAYPLVHNHVSCMVAVDDASAGNGCLEVASGSHSTVLPMDERGCIAAGTVAELEFSAIEVRAGDALWFHSRTPHRSGPNHSTIPRRAIFPTYNAASEGNQRDAYYAAKLREFATTSAEHGRVRVSLIGDFQGRPVE